MITLRIAVNPYGDLNWHYYICSRRYYDMLQRMVKQRKVEKFDFTVMKDITAETIAQGQPVEATMDDPLFTEIKKIAEKTKSEDDLETVFKKIARSAYQIVELLKDGKRKDKWEQISARVNE